MNRGVFALFVRSMREENRRISPYVIRFLLIVLVLLVVAANHRTFRYGGGAPGLAVFRLVTMLNLVFISVVGLGYFSSAITEEKEDGTLGLLRMTNLSPLSILLGKSTSRLIGFLLLLFTQLPFVTLAVALGGVSLRQILSCYLILGTFTFLLGNLALVFSVIFQRTSAAVAATLGVLLLGFWGFWFLGLLFENWFGSDLGFGALSDIMWAVNPMASLAAVFGLGFNATLITQPVAHVLTGIALFFLSWALFDVYNQGEGRGASPAAASRPGPRPRAATGRSAKPRPADFAVTWREFYFQCGGTRRLWLSFFLILGLATVILLIGASMTGRLPGIEQIGGTLIALGLLSSGVRWALEMASVFKHERQNKTWSSLTLLPRSITRIAYEKVLASLISVLPGILVASFGLVLLAEEFALNNEIFVGFFYTFSWFLFASHLVAYLSLHLKWGALPIAIVGCVVLQITFGLIAVVGGLVRSMNSVVGIWCFLLLVFSCCLHLLIMGRLQTLAAED